MDGIETYILSNTGCHPCMNNYINNFGKKYQSSDSNAKLSKKILQRGDNPSELAVPSLEINTTFKFNFRQSRFYLPSKIYYNQVL